MDDLPADVFVDDGRSFLLDGDRVGCLLLHGFTSMPAELRPLADALHRSGRTVLGLRLPGHGTHPEHLRTTRWHHHVVAAADALRLLRDRCDRVCVVGTSMGAVIALNPELAGADAYVALSTPSEPGPVPPGDALIAKETPLDPVYGIRRERDYPAYGAVPEAHIAEVVAGIGAMRDHLPSVTGPVLVVHSDADTMVPLGDMQTLVDGLAGAFVEAHVVHGLGHGMVLDPERQQVVDLIDEFVRRHLVER